MNASERETPQIVAVVLICLHRAQPKCLHWILAKRLYARRLPPPHVSDSQLVAVSLATKAQLLNALGVAGLFCFFVLPDLKKNHL